MAQKKEVGDPWLSRFSAWVGDEKELRRFFPPINGSTNRKRHLFPVFYYSQGSCWGLGSLQFPHNASTALHSRGTCHFLGNTLTEV